MILKPTYAMMAVDPFGGGGGGSSPSPRNPGEIALDPPTAAVVEIEDEADDYFAPEYTDEAPPEATTGSVGGDSDSTFGDMPGQHEIWNIDGTLWIVWFVPGTEPPVPIMYEITPDIEVTESITADKTMTQAEAAARGALGMGSARLVDRPDQHPIETFVDKWEAELKVKPWLEDPEIYAKMLGAFIEGRQMTLAELQDTEWWRTHTDGQRDWLALYHSDPMTAEQLIEDGRMLVRDAMIASGIDNPDQGLIELIADQGTTRNWSATYMNAQIKALADPFSGLTIDPLVQEWLTDTNAVVNTTRTYEAEVRDIVSRWLGPAFAAGWSDDNIKQWAGEFRNNPDAETELIDTLRAQRLALFPSYTNPDLTYEDIAAPWRGFFMQHWGVQPDEMDGFFGQIVNLNDAGKAARLLREKGLDEGNYMTTLNATKDFAQAFGGAVIRSDPAVR